MFKKIFFALFLFMLVYFCIGSVADFYTDYCWFNAQGQKDVFLVLFFAKFTAGLVFGSIFVCLFFLNYLLMRVLGGRGRIFTENILDRLRVPKIGSTRILIRIIICLGVIALGFVMGSAASSFWHEALMFANSVPFGQIDPIFDKDVSFFVFKLPFLKFVFRWSISALVVVTGFSFLFHSINGGIRLGRGVDFSLFARTHIAVLLGCIVLLSGLNYRLAGYELLLKGTGKFFGAGYTAVNAKLIAYNASMVLSFIAAGLLFANIVVKSFKFPAIVFISLFPLYFIIGTILPGIQQRFIVVPNELDKERPFIENNIKFTRMAYDLDRIKKVQFSNVRTLTYSDIKKNDDTLENIRLWDWRPLKQTYKQLQELKPYYRFNDVDVDRYMINGRKTAVNLSARELFTDGLAQNSLTWQNRHLMYTHGYGLALSRVDRISSEGQPVMLIYDIPPKSDIDIKVERPEIYYGEHRNPYIITNTSIEPGEFDYPWGDENKFTTYAGTGGVKLDSFFKRLMFAISNGDMNLLISGNIEPESRILYKQNILLAVTTLAPFLEIDDDPYLVVSEGRLFWVIDAFTTSGRFPYSTPVNFYGSQINYIRNSVKIIIDAYNGDITCCAIDEEDPILAAYKKIFPNLFKSVSDISDDIQSHFRYSCTMFDIQSAVLLKYHVTDPTIFYNNEDMWRISKQVYENKEEQMESYYLVTRLPDENSPEFIVIVPFTPYGKDNMISFLTAKCDMPNYGELKLYQLPKDKLSYGPLQVEARINQDPEISKQLTLWSQKGSSVIRGNMMAIPIEESILFIEPLYLKAETSEMPELKQIVVSYNEKIVMEADLSTAIEKLFYSGTAAQMQAVGQSESPAERIKSLADKALTHYNRAQEYVKTGNWKGYGDELAMLREVLLLMKQTQL